MMNQQKMEWECLETLIDWVRYAASRFLQASLHYGHGTDNAYDEAFALILYGLHLSHEMPDYLLQSRLLPSEKQVIFNLIERRAIDRIPLAYLTGHIKFADIDFFVNEHVLIPRSPIAELIEKNFRPWINADEIDFTLDLCTGSGCIAVAMALHMPGIIVHACDISANALDVAQKNVKRYGLENEVILFQSDLFSRLPTHTRYDLIVSNPPYVDENVMRALPAEYLHEPQLALHADDDGLAFVMQILQQAPHYLTDNGVLIVEVGASEDALVDRFPQVDFTWLEFERGGSGVFLLTKEQLQSYHSLFMNYESGK